MAQVTTSALKLAQDYVDGIILVEKKKAGLATTFHQAICARLDEHDAERSMTAEEKTKLFLTLAGEMEEYAQKQIDESDLWEAGTPLLKAVPSFKQAKSDYKSGMRQNLDPRDFKSHSAFRIKKNEGGTTTASDKGGSKGEGSSSEGNGGGEAANETGTPASNVSAIPDTSGLSESARKALVAAVKTLEQLPEDQQLEVANNFAGAASRKLRALKHANPAMANVKTG